MSDDTFNTRNTMTGRLQRVTQDQYEVFSDYLMIVADDAKPYAPGLFKPGKVGEFENPEPPTDAQLQAEAEHEAVLEDHAPNSKVAREAKAAREQADADAEAARVQAEADAQAVIDGNVTDNQGAE